MHNFDEKNIVWYSPYMLAGIDAKYPIDLNILFNYKGFRQFLQDLAEKHWLGYDEDEKILTLFAFKDDEKLSKQAASLLFSSVISDINLWILNNVKEENKIVERELPKFSNKSTFLSSAYHDLLKLYTKCKVKFK